MRAPTAPLVSVVIPCYNQARFLTEAVKSVLAQTYPNVEIVIVNDGSTDRTAAMAAHYPQARYLYQSNQGRSAARNSGARRSKGDYLVFLDADDMLLKTALEDGMNCFNAHPESGCVYGRYHLIEADGTPLPTPPRTVSDINDYPAFLRHNGVGMLAGMIFRRAVFESVNGFDPALHACEDHELFMRIARQYPIRRHPHFAALYRQHSSNTSRNSHLMLMTALRVARAQKPWVKGRLDYEQAWREGTRFARAMYSNHLIVDLQRNLKSLKTWPLAVYQMMLLLRYYPDGLLKGIGRRFSVRKPGILPPQGAVEPQRVASLSGRYNQPSIKQPVR